jgi:thioredoxin-related protein
MSAKTDYNAMKSTLTGLLLAALLAALGARAASGLVDAVDLAADGREAGRLGAPVLVFYAADGCSYCRTVEDLYLEPMQTRDPYAGKLVIRVVHTRRRTEMHDFAGRATSHAAFAAEQGVNFTPAIRLYDAQGRELVPPLVGYTTPDFYAGYLESAIERSQAILARRAASAASIPRLPERCAPEGARTC